MTGKSKYQLVILGANAARFRRVLVRALNQRLNEIGNLRHRLSVLDAAHAHERDPLQPAVGIYFGDDPARDVAELDDLLVGAIAVLPVVSDLGLYQASVPAVLHPINGMALDPKGSNLAALINLVLENLALLRRTRRLFLSYKRTESGAVAQQLRTAFDDVGYDAFLDTNSVPKGDDFQAVLWHRLLDSDIMIVLDTKNFLDSRYTPLEIAQAGAMSVGILQVLWPGVTRAPYSLLASPHQLTRKDFVGDRLTDTAVERITEAAERLRARCIAARHASLIVEFCAEAARAGARVAIQPDRYVLAEMAGRRIAAIPAVGIPDAQRYHEASNRFASGGIAADAALLIYDHRGMLPQWTAFLDWLDDFLPVKGMRVTDTAARLAGA